MHHDMMWLEISLILIQAELKMHQVHHYQMNLEWDLNILLASDLHDHIFQEEG